MITIIQYLTRPNAPKEYQSEIYKHLLFCAIAEGILYSAVIFFI
jgi:hypothetical protein